MDVSKGFFRYTTGAHLVVTDEDAADFLQSQFTNELRPFEAGRCTYGLWLDVKGKVHADSWVLCEGEERFRVYSEGCAGNHIRQHLEKHIIADDVEIEVAAPAEVFELSVEALNHLELSLPEPGKWLQTEFGLLSGPRKSIYNMLVADGKDADRLEEALVAAGYALLSPDLRGLARIQTGIPLVPVEIGPTDLPGEGEFELDAISFTKGCYLGQEVVARMHNIGKAQRRLFVVEGEGAVSDLPLALYNSESKQVGELRTAYADGDRWRGVAILKTRFAGEGESLLSEDIQISVIKPLRESTCNE